jgi:creatinine amidohydrolase/Fe(II)-dependent formamide hydrolase-like protein
MYGMHDQEQGDDVPRIRNNAPFVNERHCSNCNNLAACWSRDSEALPPWRPIRFALREGWDTVRESDYLKRIHGGICENFVMHHVNIELSDVDRMSMIDYINKVEARTGWDK